MDTLQVSDLAVPGRQVNSTLENQFSLMKEAVSSGQIVNYESRLSNLNALYNLIDSNAEAICKALSQDFGGRSEQESMVSDVVGSLSSIRFLRRNLRKLMRPRSRRVSLWYWPAKNTVSPQPLGVVGVMSPWNYPVHLMIAPVASALAAGNRVLAKMSEDTPAVSDLIQKLVDEVFPADTLRIVTGGPESSAKFASLAFDHLLFTGSTAVGRKIALAAAQNLTPVTLELSGKSPVVVTESFDTQEAAKRVAWGKMFNAGQTCVAPDYAFVPQDRLIEFVRGCRYAVNGFFPAGVDDESYTAVINARQFGRLQGLVEDARQNGVEVITLGDASDKPHKMPLTLVINPSEKCRIYSEEVFGPILSIFTYEDLDEVIKQINLLEDPLAMYVFTRYSAQARYLATTTRAAGASVNDTLLHYLQNDLPFGGRGTSGHGRYHGKEGFETFSHVQPMFQQRGIGKFTSLKLLYPPHGKISSMTGALIRRLP